MKDKNTGVTTAKTKLETSLYAEKRLEVIFAVLIASCLFDLRFITYHGTPITTSSV